MRRCEVWWADLPLPAGRRPVVLLSRDEAYAVRAQVTVAPVTTNRRRIPVEVDLGPEDGLPKMCVVNLDSLTYAGNLANLSDIAGNSRYRFLRGDITQRDQVRAAMQLGVTDIINFAAESHVDRSIQDSGPFVRTSTQSPSSFSPCSRNLKSPFANPSTGSAIGSHVPRSHSITVPPPYSPFGMVPSNVP